MGVKARRMEVTFFVYKKVAIRVSRSAQKISQDF